MPPLLPAFEVGDEVVLSEAAIKRDSLYDRSARGKVAEVISKPLGKWVVSVDWVIPPHEVFIREKVTLEAQALRLKGVGRSAWERLADDDPV